MSSSNFTYVNVARGLGTSIKLRTLDQSAGRGRRWSAHNLTKKAEGGLFYYRHHHSQPYKCTFKLFHASQCRSAHDLAKKLGVDAPIIEGIYRVIHEGADPKAVTLQVRNAVVNRATFLC